MACSGPRFETKTKSRQFGMHSVGLQICYGKKAYCVASAVTIIVLRRLVFGFFLFSTDSKFRKQMMANAPSCPKMHWTRETHCRVSRVYFRALIGKVETIVPQSAKPKITSLIWQHSPPHGYVFRSLRFRFTENGMEILSIPRSFSDRFTNLVPRALLRS